MGDLLYVFLLIFLVLGSVCSLVGGGLGLAMRPTRADWPKTSLLLASVVGSGAGLLATFAASDLQSDAIFLVTGVAAASVAFLVTFFSPAKPVLAAVEVPSGSSGKPAPEANYDAPEEWKTP